MVLKSFSRVLIKEIFFNGSLDFVQYLQPHPACANTGLCNESSVTLGKNGWGNKVQGSQRFYILSPASPQTSAFFLMLNSGYSCKKWEQ